MVVKKGSVLAIDVGSSALRLALFSLKAGKVQVEQCSSIPISLEEESDVNRDSNRLIRATALEKLIQEAGINPVKVSHSIITLPGKDIGIKEISTVKLTSEELESSLLYEARKHLPVKAEEILLDYQIQRETDDNLELLLVVTSRDAVEDTHQILKECGMKSDVIEVPVLALVNSIIFARKGKVGDRLILSVGYSSTQVVLHTKDGTIHSREIPVGGFHFTDELRKDKQISFDEAEELKRKEGVCPESAPATSSEEGASTGLSLSLALATDGHNKAVENLTRELQRSIRFFIKEAAVESLEEAILTGGCAADSTLRAHLEKELRISFSPFEPFEANDISPAVHLDDCHQYAPLIGMGLRRLHELFPNKFK